jgi:hypothetical protein
MHSQNTAVNIRKPLRKDNTCEYLKSTGRPSTVANPPQCMYAIIQNLKKFWKSQRQLSGRGAS